jgi:hypothetical protein
MISTSPLAEARLKLERGRKHLKTLDAEIQKFHEGDNEPYTVVCEFDPERAQNVARFKVLKSIPQHSWGLILGDAVHNARSVLDYIAWRLAGSDPNDLLTLFHVCRHRAKFESLRFRLKRLHPNAFAEIRDLQPYLSPDPNHSLLWLLEELDARDKHKLIAMTQSITRVHSFRGTGQILIPYPAIEEPAEDGTILAEFAGSLGQNVDMEFEFASRVIFESGVLSAASGTYDVMRILPEAFWCVETIIDYFERLMMGNPHWIPD